MSVVNLNQEQLVLTSMVSAASLVEHCAYYLHPYRIVCPGSAIYVYGIIVHNSSNPTTGADYSFFLDNQVAEPSFTIPAASASSDQNSLSYNVLLFSSESLSHGEHWFILQNGREGGDPSLILFDYLIYTRWVNMHVPDDRPPFTNLISHT